MIASQLIGKVELQGADQAKKHLAEIGEHTKAAGGFLTSFASTALGVFTGGALVAGVGKVVDVFSDMVREGAAANEGIEQTNAVLKSTHGAAGMTAAAVDDMATAYMNLTGIQDDTIRGTENMLLTFTNIGAKGGVFYQATKTALDMSVALGQDTKSSAIQLGKALNDPLTGITALQRVGVTFNDKQKELIKTYMEHGQTAKAQGVILQELSKEFGGSAEAAGRANGGVKILAAQFDNIKQSIGQAVIPILIKLGTAIEPVFAWLADKLPGAIATVSGFIESHLQPILANLGTWFKGEGLPALMRFGTFIQDNVLPVVQQLGEWFQTKALPALMRFGQFVQTSILPVLMQLGVFVENNVLPVAKTLGEVFVTNVLPALQQVWTAISENLLPALEHIISKIAPVLNPVLGVLGWLLQHVVGPALSLVITILGQLLVALGWVIDRLGDFLGAIGDAVGHVIEFFETMEHKALEVIAAIPGPWQDGAKAMLKTMDDLKRQADEKQAAMVNDAKRHADEKKLAMVQKQQEENQAQLAQLKAQHDAILAQMDKTTDEAQRAALEKKLKVVDTAMAEKQGAVNAAQQEADGIVGALHGAGDAAAAAAAHLNYMFTSGIYGAIPSAVAAARAYGNAASSAMAAADVGPRGSRQFASGGIIDEPVVGVGTRTGMRYTFAEQGPELVVPNSGLHAAGGMGGGGAGAGGTIHVTIPVVLNGREVGRAVLPDFTDALRRQVPGARGLGV